MCASNVSAAPCLTRSPRTTDSLQASPAPLPHCAKRHLPVEPATMRAAYVKTLPKHAPRCLTRAMRALHDPSAPLPDQPHKCQQFNCMITCCSSLDRPRCRALRHASSRSDGGALLPTFRRRCFSAISFFLRRFKRRSRPSGDSLANSSSAAVVDALMSISRAGHADEACSIDHQKVSR